jgi:hypothetical protein
MEFLTQDAIHDIIEEIKGDAEISRRAGAKKRHDIYLDGGKEFLLEQISREFSAEAVAEMRLAPINLLKKIVNKRSVVYKVPPVRKTELEPDQSLVDFYVSQLSLNEQMQKANRYFTLFSNCALYVRPSAGKLKLSIVPSYLYSIIPNPVDQTVVEAWVFSAFTEEGRVAPQADVPAASGVEGYRRERGIKQAGDKVASNEKDDGSGAGQFIWWTNHQHLTTNEKGELLNVDPSQPVELQVVNPIEMAPVVNLAKDRDNEPWATQGEDAVDLSLAIMSGWTDLLTIAKHQGFSILTVVSAEEPKQLKIGVNKAVWLRQREGQPAPSISYVTGNSPLAEYKDLLQDLLALLLSSNDMPPNALGGKATKNFTSGFHALIEMSDTLEAVEQDKPALRNAEMQLWEVIKRWHNYLYDLNELDEEARSFGKFSDAFAVSINFRDIKPVESEQEVLATVKQLRDLGLITRRDALKKLHPDMTDEQLDAKLVEIDKESQKAMKEAQEAIGLSSDEKEQENAKDKQKSRESE